MVRSVLSVTFLVLIFPVTIARNHGLNRTGSTYPPAVYLKSPLPHEDPVFVASLPAVLDWRNVSGVDYTSIDRDQHQPGPGYCGACWAFATTSHLNDRLNIHRGNVAPKANVAVQVIITCGPSFENGCDGGDPSAAVKWIHDQGGIPDESCHNYEAKSLTCHNRTGPEDTSISSAVCMDCKGDWGPTPNTCGAIEKYPQYSTSGYGSILPTGNLSDAVVVKDMVLRMKAEITKRGPIVCQISCPDPTGTERNGYLDDYMPLHNQFGPNYEPRVLHNKLYTCPEEDWDNCVDHNVAVSGFGVERGPNGEEVPYWIVRNSWGTWWGEHGWFRIVQGVNNLGIESRCDFAVV